MRAPAYIIDANILIESHRLDYTFDICPGFWELMQKGFESGLIVCHDKVYQEIKQGDDSLWKWVSRLDRKCFLKEDEADFEVYRALAEWASNCQYSGPALSTFLDPDYADSWICAKAKNMGLTLVTQEVPAPLAKRDVKLPDACNFAGVPYCNKLTMLRSLRAAFLLDPNHRFA